MERLDAAIPNVFYDLIVFVSPAILLTTGTIVGLGGWPLDALGEAGTKGLGAIDVVLISLGLLFLGYEYGRMAEALSATFVQAPLKWMARRRLVTNPDFNSPHQALCAKLPLELTDSDDQGSKWTLYFFASLVAPAIGRDLLKRYAWEKLSRSSAFTFLLMTATSLTLMTLSRWIVFPEFGGFGFGSVKYTLVAGILTLLTYVEYYKRNCWNNDLLRRTLPVIVYAASSKVGSKDHGAQ